MRRARKGRSFSLSRRADAVVIIMGEAAERLSGEKQAAQHTHNNFATPPRFMSLSLMDYSLCAEAAEFFFYNPARDFSLFLLWNSNEPERAAGAMMCF